MLSEHGWARCQALNEECAQKNREHHVAWHAECDCRNESPTEGRVIRRARAENATYIAFTEPRPIGRTLHGVRISHPLADRCSEPGNDAHEHAQGAATHRDPPVPESVLHAFPNATQFAGRAFGDAGPFRPKIKHLRNSEETGSY